MDANGTGRELQQRVWRIRNSIETLEQVKDRIVSFLQKVGIDTLNIPEVVDEERGGVRSVPYTRKQPVESFARIIRVQGHLNSIRVF